MTKKPTPAATRIGVEHVPTPRKSCVTTGLAVRASIRIGAAAYKFEAAPHEKKYTSHIRRADFGAKLGQTDSRRGQPP